MGRRRLLVGLLVLLVGGAVLAPAGSTARAQEGGILGIAVSPMAPLDYVDPALSFSPMGWLLLGTAASAFELTARATLTPPLYYVPPDGGTFRSGAPFRASGRFVEPNEGIGTAGGSAVDKLRNIAYTYET